MSDKVNVQIDIIEFGKDAIEIPKNIIISDRALRRVESIWVRELNAVVNLLPGTYLFEIFLPSGWHFGMTKEVGNKMKNVVVFQPHKLSPFESHEWAYFTTTISSFQSQAREIRSTNILGLNSSIWTLSNGTWKSKPGPIIDGSLPTEGIDFEIDLSIGLHMLEISAKNTQPVFACIPPARHVQCLIKPSKRTDPIEVVISSKKFIAESILTCLIRGASQQAEELANALDFAEDLLLDKRIDPASAAIGGYYLLRMGGLERIDDWPRNITNQFEWLPDGPIIYGWQLLQKGKLEGRVNASNVFKLFVTAWERGVPIYSEGLRLLLEGLRILDSYIKGENRRTFSNMFTQVRDLCHLTNWARGTTTFSISTVDLFGSFPMIGEVRQTPLIASDRSKSLPSKIVTSYEWN